MEVPAAVRERLSGGLGTVLPSKACPKAPPPPHGGKLMPALWCLLAMEFMLLMVHGFALWMLLIVLSVPQKVMEIVRRMDCANLHNVRPAVFWNGISELAELSCGAANGDLRGR